MSQIDDIRKRHEIGETLAACSREDDEESEMCRWYQHDVGILLNEVDRLQRGLDAAVADIHKQLACECIEDMCVFCSKCMTCDVVSPCEPIWRGEQEGE